MIQLVKTVVDNRKSLGIAQALLGHRITSVG